MREITATTTQRNQVTIPAEVRCLLGLEPGDAVAFTIDDEDEVRLTVESFSLESAYGSVKPSKHPEDFDEVCRNAKDAKAEDTAKDLIPRTNPRDYRERAW